MTRRDFEAIQFGLKEVGRLEAEVVTGSMAPLLPVGQQISFTSCRIEELKKFDIVLFFAADKIVCHFFWSYNPFAAANGERMILTRSLASSETDFPVRESDFLGWVDFDRISILRFYWLSLCNRTLHMFRKN